MGELVVIKAMAGKLLATQGPTLTVKVKMRDSGMLLANKYSGVVTAYCYQTIVYSKYFCAVEVLQRCLGRRICKLYEQ